MFTRLMANIKEDELRLGNAIKAVTETNNIQKLKDAGYQATLLMGDLLLLQRAIREAIKGSLKLADTRLAENDEEEINMAVTFINPGPSRYPEGGGMAAASPERGNNLLDVVLGHGNKATTIEITAEGSVDVFMNDEALPAYSAHGDLRRFYHKGECHLPGGQKCGKIESLEVVGSGQFNLIVT